MNIKDVIRHYKTKWHKLEAQIELMPLNKQAEKEFGLSASQMARALQEYKDKPNEENLDHLEGSLQRLTDLKAKALSDLAETKGNVDELELLALDNVTIAKDNKVRQRFGLPTKPLHPTREDLEEIVEAGLEQEWLSYEDPETGTRPFQRYEHNLKDLKLEMGIRKDRKARLKEDIFKFRTTVETLSFMPERVIYEEGLPAINPEYATWFENVKQLKQDLGRYKKSIDAYEKPSMHKANVSEPWLKMNIGKLIRQVDDLLAGEKLAFEEHESDETPDAEAEEAQNAN